MNDLNFEYPAFLYLLFLIPVLACVYIFRLLKREPGIFFSSFSALSQYRPTIRQRFIHLPFLLRMLALSALVVVMARPRSSSQGQNVSTEGIDIVISFDISGSMLAEDLKPNRIEAAKKVAHDFISGRQTDRIGLVVFGGESFTQCPLTTDHGVLKNLLGSVRNNMLADGTALGEGLATAVARIKDSDAKSKVIILMTDGVNNSGSIAPITAAEIAKSFDIRVYTIGVGTIGMAPYPFKTPFGTQYQDVEVQIDEPTMKEIADMTGGKYFRATNTQKLKGIYAEIDRMEKTKIEVTEFSRFAEAFFPFALVAAGCVLLEILLASTWLRKLP